MIRERMYSVAEVAQFFGVTPQAVRQRIVDGRTAAPRVRVKGIAGEYRISTEATRDHHGLSDAEMKQLASDVVRFKVGLMDWGFGLPLPACQVEHFTYDGAVNEAKRVLAILPQFSNENAAVEQRLPVRFPEGPDEAVLCRDPFDCARFGMALEYSSVEIVDGAGFAR